MIKEGYKYLILDNLEFDTNFAKLKDASKYERLLIKIFKKDNDIIVMETFNGIDTIIEGILSNKDDIYNYNLIFLGTMERIINNEYIFEKLHNIGNWVRVKTNKRKIENRFFTTKKDIKNLLRKIYF